MRKYWKQSVLLLALLCLLLTACGKDKPLDAPKPDDAATVSQEQREPNPWEESGAKQPQDYTWAEFEALTGAQQIMFQEHLGEKGFEEWHDKAQKQVNPNPWEIPDAKQPQDYTWTEFEALTGAQQIAFQNYLGEAAFEAWMNWAMGQ